LAGLLRTRPNIIITYVKYNPMPGRAQAQDEGRMAQAAILHEANTPFEIRTIGIDKPDPHELLIRVAASGLCHSDWHFVSGDLPPAGLPIVLGHEVAGIVEAVGSEVRSVAVGDHVVSCSLRFCGHCDPCVSGRTHICADKPQRGSGQPSRLTLDGKPLAQGGGMLGGFAEQMLVHENAVVRIDCTMPLDRAALLGCGVLTGVGAVFNASIVTPESKVVVIGCGGVGLNVIQAARIAGAAQIVAVDLMEEKRAMAMAFGATHAVPGGPDAVEAVRDLTGGGAHFAFEVIGRPETIADGVRMMAPSGLMTIVGATPANATIPLPGIGMVFNEWRVQGTFFGGAAFTRDIPRIVSMYLDGRFNLDGLVSERITLDQINDGFRHMLAGRHARSVITFDDVLAQAARG
jgi:S-(hydroxymethyl)glutathione dehydrogenase/alcohol dehydrogenase